MINIIMLLLLSPENINEVSAKTPPCDTINAESAYNFIEEHVNFDHLEHLNETIYLNGDSMLVTHIYSEYPDYEWVVAKDEGFTCVDDVSRAVILYLKKYEIRADENLLKKARKGLRFVMYMETEDGEFYNFLRSDYSINREGRTSKKSFNFWAARGLRSLCSGYRIFKKADSAFADTLRKHILPAIERLEININNYYGEYDYYGGIKTPLWLINGGDATSELILGLLEYYRVERTTRLKNLIEKLCEGLTRIQFTTEEGKIHGLFFSWRNLWHGWGNSQSRALLEAGDLLNKPSWIEAAKEEVDNFYPFILSRNFLHSIRIEDDSILEIKEFPQIAYDIKPMVSALTYIYKKTGDLKYAYLAGAAASWLNGNNRVTDKIYVPETGTCFDGINNATDINKNSGAESTIEALLTLLEIAPHHASTKTFFYIIEEFKRGKMIFYRGAKGDSLLIRWDEKDNQWNVVF